MLLLDTHVLLWLLTDEPRLGAGARRLVSSSDTAYVSAASLWELAIKAALGKVQVPDDLPTIVDAAGLTWLSVTPEHVWRSREIAGLPHRDPFDRLLVGQALAESLTFLTADRALLGSRLSTAVDLKDAGVRPGSGPRGPGARDLRPWTAGSARGDRGRDTSTQFRRVEVVRR